MLIRVCYSKIRFLVEKMGCICSKGSSEESVRQNKEDELGKGSIQFVAANPSKKDSFILDVGGMKKANDEDVKKIFGERPTSTNNHKFYVSRMLSMQCGPKGEQAIPGWPSWLISVAADAIKGWIPRRAESFEKLDKVSPTYALFSIPR